jgi:hypothetical protein
LNKLNNKTTKNTSVDINTDIIDKSIKNENTVKKYSQNKVPDKKSTSVVNSQNSQNKVPDKKSTSVVNSQNSQNKVPDKKSTSVVNSQNSQNKVPDKKSTSVVNSQNKVPDKKSVVNKKVNNKNSCINTQEEGANNDL